MIERLNVRWLGRVTYDEADALARSLHSRSGNYLLLLEHPHTYTLGRRGDDKNVLVAPESVGAVLRSVDRGGDVTYHGPGQLVIYPIIDLPIWRGGLVDSVAYVRQLEQVVVHALASIGFDAYTDPEYPGVWIGGAKVCAVGVKVEGRRTRHGVAINVDTDLSMFDHIVPCGITDRGVTSLVKILSDLDGPAGADSGSNESNKSLMERVADAFVVAFSNSFEVQEVERQSVAWREPLVLQSDERRRSIEEQSAEAGVPVRLVTRLQAASVEVPVADPTFRRPEWMRVKADLGAEYRGLKRLVRELDLHTVCESAGCPNIYECWADGTATFMVLGERCTRACGFCLIDTRLPSAPEADEPERVASAVVRMGLKHAVLTMVARDDLDDGGAAHVAATVNAIRLASPETRTEVLISDLRGDLASLDLILNENPDVVNHNIETVARLQRAVRPSAGYARSLALLARANAAGHVTKSGIMLGLGETLEEVSGALNDLAAVGVKIVTVGQYLRPSAQHLPVVRWWSPEEFAEVARIGEAAGINHVESGPLVRSSYHARSSAEAAGSSAVLATGLTR
ncbi:MAG: lipoyl synthase [Actinomycetes bacterium]